MSAQSIVGRKIYVYASGPITSLSPVTERWHKGDAYAALCVEGDKSYVHWGYGSVDNVALMAAYAMIRLFEFVAENEIPVKLNIITNYHNQLTTKKDTTMYDMGLRQEGKKVAAKKDEDVWKNFALGNGRVEVSYDKAVSKNDRKLGKRARDIARGKAYVASQSPQQLRGLAVIDDLPIDWLGSNAT
jgi:hypothetical protein